MAQSDYSAIKAIKPVRLMLLMGITIFLTEIVIMLSIPELSIRSPVLEAMFDGLIILIVLLPVSYFSFVQPLMNILNQKNNEAHMLARQFEEQQLLNDISSSCSYARPQSYKNYLSSALEKLRLYCTAEAIRLTILDEMGTRQLVLQVANKEMDTISMNKLWRDHVETDMEENVEMDSQYTLDSVFEESERDNQKLTIPIVLSDNLAGNLEILTDRPLERSNEVVNFAARVITTTAKGLLDQRKLRERSQELQQLNQSAQDGIVVVDELGMVESWNPAATAIFGYTAQQVLGKPLHKLLAPERYRAAADNGLNSFLKSGTGSVIGHAFEIQGNHAQGHEVPVELSISAVKTAKGWKAIGIVRDITMRKQVERRLEETLDSFSAMVSNSNEGLLIVNSKRRVEYINEAAARMFGSSIGAMEGEEISETFLDSTHIEHHYKREGLEPGWMQVKVSGTIWRGAPHSLLILSDITESVALREKLSRLSKSDELTGIFNRRGFIEASEQQIKIGSRLKLELGILFIDLDGMKPINDTFGHDMGDEALRATTQVLLRTLRKSDLVGRLGGDEFVALVQLDENKNVTETLKRIQQEVDCINESKTYPFILSLSVGSHQVDYDSPLESIIDKADEQMYHAKQSKGVARNQKNKVNKITE